MLGGVLSEYCVDLLTHLVPGKGPPRFQVIQTLVEHLLKPPDLLPVFMGTLRGWDIDVVHHGLLASNIRDAAACHKAATLGYTARRGVNRSVGKCSM
jgi:hypothetical protein